MVNTETKNRCADKYLYNRSTGITPFYFSGIFIPTRRVTGIKISVAEKNNINFQAIKNSG